MWGAASDNPCTKAAVMNIAIPSHLRRLRVVHRLQTVQPSAVLDALCEIGMRAAGADLAFCTVVDDRQHRIVGRAGSDVTVFPRIGGPVAGRRDLMLLPDMAGDVATAAHPMVDGRLERMGAAILSPLHHDGETVGMFGIAWRGPVAAFTDRQRDLVRRLAGLGEAQIRTEMTLARLAQDAFRHLDGMRG